MSSASLVPKPIGEGVLPVSTWNPRASGSDEEFNYLDLSSVDQKTKSITSAIQVAAKKAPSRARQIVYSGDILVSTVRPNLNAVAVVPDDLHEATASTGFCVLRPDNINLDGRYLFHWVKFSSFIHEMERLATGANYPAVSDRTIKNSEIPAPTIVEQKRIAAILDRADDIRRKRQQTTHLAEEFLRSVFLDMFGDPVANPKGWEVELLGEVALSFQNGIGKNKEHYGRGVKVANIGDLYEAPSFKPEKFSLLEVSEKEIENYRLSKGDLLFVRSSVKKEGVAYCSTYDSDELCLFSSFMIRLKIDDEQLLPKFLSVQLRTPSQRASLINASNTATITNINQKGLSGVRVIVPPISIQEVFIKKQMAILGVVNKLMGQMDRNKDLFNSLSQRAFRGDL